jgi:demethylmenaquinone methyltransferase/2-methoxy-6-polyprenyl-1,4-benzoquinol methylase
MKEAGALMDSRAAHHLFRLMARLMESPLRYRFFDPLASLRGAGIRAGQNVLEIGCGTGFYTVAAAEMVGGEGRVYALDPHPLAIEHVTRKIRNAGLSNVNVIRGDGTRAGLASGCIDLVLLFGVIPSPAIHLDRLLTEIHRLLRSEGVLAVWTALPWWSPAPLVRSGLFVRSGKAGAVHAFGRAAID